MKPIVILFRGLLLAGPFLCSNLIAQINTLKIIDCLTGEKIEKYSIASINGNKEIKQGDTIQVFADSYLTTTYIVKESMTDILLELCPVSIEFESVEIKEYAIKNKESKADYLFPIPYHLEFAVPFKVGVNSLAEYVTLKLLLSPNDSALSPVISYIMSSSPSSGLPDTIISNLDTFYFQRSDRVAIVTASLKSLKLDHSKLYYLGLRSTSNDKSIIDPFKQLRERNFSSLAFYRTRKKWLPVLYRVYPKSEVVPSTRYKVWVDLIRDWYPKSRKSFRTNLVVRYD